MAGGSAVDIGNTINSGQVFLWERDGSRWRGVDGQDVLEVEGAGGVESMDERERLFFRMDDDYDGILGEISADEVVGRCVRRYGGLRLLRQDPFQCCITFIVSSNSSIPNIRSGLQRLCKRMGRPVRAGGDTLHLFPTPGRIARAPLSDLLQCGIGYRAKFVKGTSRIIHEGAVDLEQMRGWGYGEAGERLKEAPGIGNKVADCIMLFSLDKLEAFPLDTWMLKVLDMFYPGRFAGPGAGAKSLTDKRYESLHAEITKHFGVHAGYAQQFLFKMIRDENKKRWVV